MQGEKQRVFKSHSDLSLETLVPQKNFYRQVQSKLDLDFVRELVAKCYTPFGRPSIDPVVFFKLHLILFFEGLRSERQLIEMVNLRLDHRCRTPGSTGCTGRHRACAPGRPWRPHGPGGGP